MAITGKFYTNPSGSKYKVDYVTPTSNALPATDRWVFLVLERRAFQELFAQKYVTVPLSRFDAHFKLASSSGPKEDDSELS